MKKSELLKAAKNYLVAETEYVGAKAVKSRFVCNALQLAARASDDTEAAINVVVALRQWISQYIHPYGSVWYWLAQANNSYHLQTDDEIYEYRKAWMDDMIAYWESKGD